MTKVNMDVIYCDDHEFKLGDRFFYVCSEGGKATASGVGEAVAAWHHGDEDEKQKCKNLKKMFHSGSNASKRDFGRAKLLLSRVLSQSMNGNLFLILDACTDSEVCMRGLED